MASLFGATGRLNNTHATCANIHRVAFQEAGVAAQECGDVTLNKELYDELAGFMSIISSAYESDGSIKSQLAGHIHSRYGGGSSRLRFEVAGWLYGLRRSREIIEHERVITCVKH